MSFKELIGVFFITVVLHPALVFSGIYFSLIINRKSRPIVIEVTKFWLSSLYLNIIGALSTWHVKLLIYCVALVWTVWTDDLNSVNDIPVEDDIPVEELTDSLEENKKDSSLFSQENINAVIGEDTVERCLTLYAFVSVVIFCGTALYLHITITSR